MKKNKDIFYWTGIGCTLFVYLQLTHSFYFYYAEQIQLFLFSRIYAINTISQPGGLSLYISRFLVQFYYLPYVGAVINTLLLLATGILIKKILDALSCSVFNYLLSALTLFSLGVLHLNADYSIQGTISFLFILLLLFFYTRIQSASWRLIPVFFVMPFLYAAAGPVCHLFALSVFLWEILVQEEKWYLSFFLLPFFLLIGWLAVRTGFTGDYQMAFLPDVYADPLVSIPEIYYAWYILPVSIVLSFCLGKFKSFTASTEWWLFFLQLIVVGFLGYKLGVSYNIHPVIQKNLVLDYYIGHSEWDKVLMEYDPGVANNQTKNMVYLAVTKKKKLGEQLFHYHAHEWRDLFLPWNNSMRHAFMLSDLYYHIGIIASAQEMAFESYVASNQGGSARSLLRLIETNLISGEYRVAEKYIFLLEKTCFYKKKAATYRQYLFNDRKVERDPLLGPKRSLFYSGEFVLSKNIVVLLESLLIKNSSTSVALDYLTSILLLNKDLKKFKELMDTYYGTEVWPELTRHQQEAVVAIYQHSPSEWVSYGVSKEVEQHFISFDQDMRQKRGSLNFQKMMENNYGKTLWYHLIFIEK